MSRTISNIKTGKREKKLILSARFATSLPTAEEPEKEINLNVFFIYFGFNQRKTAVNKLMNCEVISKYQKEYLQEVYINNDFKEVCMSFSLLGYP